MPATPACATKAAELSTSVASRSPPRVSAALVSVRLAVLRAGDHRRVVGAQDADGDDLAGAVGGRHREAVGVGRAADELVVGRCSWCRSRRRWHRCEGAVAVGAGHAGLRHEGRRAVDVGGVEIAAGALRRIGLRQAGRLVPVITAASLVPRMLTVMTWLVPSAVATVKLSV